MAKPILIISVPHGEFINQADKVGQCRLIQQFKDTLSDEYHLFFIVFFEKSDWDFKLLSDKDIEPVTLEELKKLIGVRV